MADYRLYYLDRDGHVTGAVEFTCANDDVAAEAATRAADGKSMELWQLKRRVSAREAEVSAGRSSPQTDTSRYIC